MTNYETNFVTELRRDNSHDSKKLVSCTEHVYHKVIYYASFCDRRHYAKQSLLLTTCLSLDYVIQAWFNLMSGCFDGLSEFPVFYWSLERKLL